MTAADWLAAASAASQLGGSYAHSRSARAQNMAQASAMEAERQKQHALQQEANQAIAGAAQGVDPAAQQKQLAEAQAARTAAAQPQPVPTQGYQTTTASAPKVVESDQERKLSEALAGGERAATRSGNLQGYGDSALSTQIGIGRAGQKIGQLANFSHGLSNTLPFQLESAYNRGGNWGAAGEGLDAAGRLGTLYASTRKPRGIGYGAAGTAAGTAQQYDAFGNLVGVI